MLKRSLGMFLLPSVAAQKRSADSKIPLENERDSLPKPHAQAALEHATGFFLLEPKNLDLSPA